ncbi:hypothetical protein PBV52_07050 [Streptomyces sp. T12]|uniref:hypothetical protein n=1 Tax=Streptomyces sp. T12 TaxID=477697 RepID=UPI0023668341|nr:hypothetical protein [Streptomyces sp. T12]WDF36542.1 hypothetical protein PBV52_07050 [Streptomyces sp. T12]
MHRTTTTATLLVTVAVSALSGCVTVPRSPAPGPPPVPSQPPAPRPGGQEDPRVVQAPAREALALTGPSPSPARTTSAAHSASPTTSPAHTPAAPRSHPHPHPHPRPQHRESHRPAVDTPKRPHIEIPDVSESVRTEVPRGNSDLCALGKKYGGWRADSPESRICEQTYGR